MMTLLTTLANGLRVLETVAALGSQQGVEAKKVADHTGMQRTTVYSYLYTLQEMGYLEKVGDDPGASYKLRSRVLRLARHYLDELDLRRQASPVLADLVTATGLTAHLAILDEGKIVYLDKAEPDSPIQMRSSVGASAPAYSTAAGKAILAYVSERCLEEEVLSKGLSRRTANTITSESEFLAHLARVREQGYAVDDVENENGIRCVGAPIFDLDGNVVAAISLTGLHRDLELSRIPELAVLVRRAVEDLSRQLGYRAPAARR